VKKKSFLISGFILLLILGLALCPLFALEGGEKCPTFSFTTLENGVYGSSQVLGNKNFLLWFTDFDENSLDELTQLVSLYQRLPRSSYEFLVVSVKGDARSLPESIKKQYSVPFPMLIDPQGRMCAQFSGFYIQNVVPLQNLFIVNKSGVFKLVDHFPGFPFRDIEKILKEE